MRSLTPGLFLSVQTFCPVPCSVTKGVLLASHRLCRLLAALQARGVWVEQLKPQPGINVQNSLLSGCFFRRLVRNSRRRQHTLSDIHTRPPTHTALRHAHHEQAMGKTIKIKPRPRCSQPNTRARARTQAQHNEQQDGAVASITSPQSRGSKRLSEHAACTTRRSKKARLGSETGPDPLNEEEETELPEPAYSPDPPWIVGYPDFNESINEETEDRQHEVNQPATEVAGQKSDSMTVRQQVNEQHNLGNRTNGQHLPQRHTQEEQARREQTGEQTAQQIPEQEVVSASGNQTQKDKDDAVKVGLSEGAPATISNKQMEDKEGQRKTTSNKASEGDEDEEQVNAEAVNEADSQARRGQPATDDEYYSMPCCHCVREAVDNKKTVCIIVRSNKVAEKGGKKGMQDGVKRASGPARTCMAKNRNCSQIVSPLAPMAGNAGPVN
ncbi:hypothetical protein NM208_g12412 [Fusarium decemcellulare]|uniref:Uncharacterized protein n=1 Tax=Fusarium decemcellulare TaxID=57161 RepID=A0ACC1RRB7_9HYPO|nr:hypothetical protein NM208_g12412 [Fusarium decemcellulare]